MTRSVSVPPRSGGSRRAPCHNPHGPCRVRCLFPRYLQRRFQASCGAPHFPAGASRSRTRAPIPSLLVLREKMRRRTGPVSARAGPRARHRRLRGLPQSGYDRGHGDQMRGAGGCGRCGFGWQEVRIGLANRKRGVGHRNGALM